MPEGGGREGTKRLATRERCAYTLGLLGEMQWRGSCAEPGLVGSNSEMVDSRIRRSTRCLMQKTNG